MSIAQDFQIDKIELENGPGLPFVQENEGGSAFVLEEERRATAPLGITRKFLSGSTPEGPTSPREAAQKHKYELLEAAQSLLPGEGVAACLQFVVPDKTAEVRYNDDSGHASVHGVGVCGSVWTCPVCSQRINRERGAELQHVIERHTQVGGEALLLTLTLQHNKGDRLEDLKDILKASWTDTQTGRPWRRFKANYGYMGSVTAVEPLQNEKSGWHPHLHVVMFLRKPPTDGELRDIEDYISDRWALKVEKNGGYASVRYGCKVTRGESAALYVTKFTSEMNWDLSRELTGSAKKSGKGRSPWQLLDAFNAGDEAAGKLFVEYAKAMKGSRQFYWGPGLREKLELFFELGLAVEDALDQSDEEVLLESLEREKEASRQVVTFTSKQWYHIASNNLIGELLRVTELTRGDSERVWAWCVDIAGIPASGPAPGVNDAKRKADLDALQAALRAGMAHRTGSG